MAITALMSSPWLLREWHAWRGHVLFVEKRFGEASSHLVHVRHGKPLYAAALNLPPMQHLYAQSLLILGREAEAVQQYSELADLDTRRATLALIMALHDGTRSNWESAVARLERHKESPACQPCKPAHEIFRSAAEAQAKLVVARREQEVHLASMKLPAGCLFYRVGSASASALAEQFFGFIKPSMVRYLQASGVTKQATERMVSFAMPLMQRAFGNLIEDVARGASGLEISCAQRVQLSEILRLNSIPYVAGIQEWVEFKTLEEHIGHLPYVGSHVKGATSALEVAVYLRELGAFAVAYAAAFRAESVAHDLIRTADAHAKSEWDAIKRAARDPEFARKGVTLTPSEKSWVQTIKPYVWPF